MGGSRFFDCCDVIVPPRGLLAHAWGQVDG